MPTFQVTTRELVYVDRTYDIKAADIDAARDVAKERQGEMVDEQMGDTWDFVRIISAELIDLKE